MLLWVIHLQTLLCSEIKSINYRANLSFTPNSLFFGISNKIKLLLGPKRVVLSLSFSILQSVNNELSLNLDSKLCDLTIVTTNTSTNLFLEFQTCLD